MSKPTASARLPERARLAAAIERHDAAKAVFARIEQAIEKIKSDRIGDYTSIASARDALAVARSGRSEILISKALDEPAPDLPDIASAQATLDAAEASLDASRAALRTLEGEAQRARSTLDLAEQALKRAVAEVVAGDPTLKTLEAEFARSMARSAQLWRALRTAGVFVNNVVEQIGGDDPAWISVLAVLRENPDAPLPDLPPDEPLDHARPGGRRAA